MAKQIELTGRPMRVSLGVIIAMLASLSVGQAPQEANDSEAFRDGVDAYIYGYPLMMIGLTERVATTVGGPVLNSGRAPINQLIEEDKLPNGSYTDVVLPSTSTLYVSTFLSLKAEPMVLHIPFINRFYLMQTLDAWTNVSEQSPGTRRHSTPGDYAFVGPDYTGDPAIPPGVIRIDMPTNTVWIIGRIFTSGTPGDLDYLKGAVLSNLKLLPLSAFIQGGDYTAPSNLPVDPSIETKTTPLHQVANMDACAFFGTLAAMLKTNSPLLPQDERTVERLAKIGIVPGSPFDCSDPSIDPQTKAALQLATVAGRAAVENLGSAIPPTTTNWFFLTKILGDYKMHYLIRAVVANQALGANLPQDAVYGYATSDSNNEVFKIKNKYKLHFNPSGATTGQLPPVNPKGFWSVTIYNANGTLVNRPDLPRNKQYNAIGVGPLGPTIQNHTACLNPDKSMDLYFQVNPPAGGIALCNWIPLPKKGNTDSTKNDFIVFLRMYWPDAGVLNGQWIPPAVTQ